MRSLIVNKLLRKVPHFKGKFRLIRLLQSARLAGSRDELVSGRHGLVYKLPNLVETISFSIFADGIYEERNIRFILDQLPPGAILLDLGANIGAIAMPLARLRPDVSIIAVEASPKVFAYLEYNVKANGLKNITLVNKALSDADDQLVSFYSPDLKFGKGSMSPVFTEQAETVRTITVDSLLAQYQRNQVHFIKIDVEGYESMVFKGARNLLTSDQPPNILFEFAGWAEKQAKGASLGDAQRLIRSMGFQIFNADDPRRLVRLDEDLLTGMHMLYATRNGKT